MAGSALPLTAAPGWWDLVAYRKKMTSELLGDPYLAIAVHEHPVRPRKARNSYVCGICRHLRYELVHSCASCPDVTYCPACIEAALQEQEACIAEARSLEAERAASEHRKRANWRRTEAGGAADDEGLPPLLSACVIGDFVLAKEIIEKSDFLKDLDLEATTNHGAHAGRTALILAAQHGHKQIVELLLGRDTQREAVDNHGMTPLMHAAYSGFVDVVDELLFAGVIVDRVAFCGYTSMLFAANRGHVEVVRRLLAAGASPLARTPAGRNALIVASFNGHVETVKVLLKVPGMELDASDDEGYSAHDAALANNFANIAQLVPQVS